MEAIWQAVKEVIKNQLPEATFDLWIEPLQAESGPGVSWCYPVLIPLLSGGSRPLSQTHRPDTGNGLELKTGGASQIAHRPGAPPGPGASDLPAPGGGKTRRPRFNRAFTFDQFWWGLPTGWLTRPPRPWPATIPFITAFCF